jgi:hypothetical protein
MGHGSPGRAISISAVTISQDGMALISAMTVTRSGAAAPVSSSGAAAPVSMTSAMAVATADPPQVAPGARTDHSLRNGLVRRSAPMVEPGPWPQMKLTSSPSGNSFSVIERIRAA